MEDAYHTVGHEKSVDEGVHSSPSDKTEVDHVIGHFGLSFHESPSLIKVSEGVTTCGLPDALETVEEFESVDSVFHSCL